MMKLLYIAVLVCLATGATLSAQSFAGKWCGQLDSTDCIVITSKAPEVVSAVFYSRGQAYAEAGGYARDGKLVLSFRRISNRDLGFATFVGRDAKTADARTFNPDGTIRWKGVYVKQ